MPSTVFHVGAHKTGTTLIQRSLLALRPDLEERGVAVMTHMDGEWDGADMMSVIKAIPAEEAIGDASARLAAALPVWRGGADTLLVSSEMLMGPRFVDPVASLYGHADRSARLLHDAADECCRIVVYIREQAGYLDAVYRHKVQNGFTLPFSEWLEGIDLGALSWAPAVDAYRRTVGSENVTVMPFWLPEVGPAAHVLGFLEAATGFTDLDPPDIPDQASNYSLSDVGVEIFRFANTLMTEEDRSEMRPVLRRVFSSATHPSTPLVSEETRRLLEDRYAEENAALLT